METSPRSIAPFVRLIPVKERKEREQGASSGVPYALTVVAVWSLSGGVVPFTIRVRVTHTVIRGGMAGGKENDFGSWSGY